MNDSARGALGVAAGYAVAAIVWIISSDRLLLAFVHDPRLLTRFQTAKGIGFQLAAAGLIFWLTYRLLERGAAVRRRLERAQHAARLGSWELDVGSGRLSWDAEAHDIHGLEVGATMEEMLATLHPEDLEVLRSAVREAVATGDPLEVRHQIRRPDGTVRWVRKHGLLSAEEGQPARLTGTVQDVTAHSVAELKLRRATARLGELSLRLLDVQEAERRHLARELHDEVGQGLTIAHILLEKARQGSRRDEDLEPVSGAILAVLQQIRDLSLDLRPSMLDDLGLLAALRWLLDRKGRALCLDARLDCRLEEEMIPKELRTPIFRFVQEALTNTLRHAEATRFRVKLTIAEDRLALAVEDDGKGFDVEAAWAAAERGDSHGLLGMRERVQLVGGAVVIESDASGTRLTATLPLEPVPEPVSGDHAIVRALGSDVQSPWSL